MKLNEYQTLAADTATYPEKGGLMGLVYTSLGLTGEAGEVSEKVKKLLRDHGGELNTELKEGLIKELGDVLWYLAQCSKELGVTLEEVAAVNLFKLQSRKERGKLKGSGDNR